jgi:hypothetical protein
MFVSNQTNQDLIWTVGDRQYSERSAGFLKRFENTMCLFSGSVRQLYSNYEIHSLRSDSRRLVALPNPNSFHDTFFNVTDSAVKPTGLFIVPSEAANDEESQALRLVYRSKKTQKFKSMPLAEGIQIVKNIYDKEGQFLPVIINKDLQFRKNNMPIMHLHRLDLDALKHASTFQLKDISMTIERKLDELVRSAG